MRPRHAVSVKGVLLLGGQVVLLRNERDEWELPGGRLEDDEAPEACLAREIAEELDIDAQVGPLLDCWQYAIAGHGTVLIVAYGCTAPPGARPKVSHEHSAVACFDPRRLDSEPLPAGYRRAIDRWLALQA